MALKGEDKAPKGGSPTKMKEEKDEKNVTTEGEHDKKEMNEEVKQLKMNVDELKKELHQWREKYDQNAGQWKNDLGKETRRNQDGCTCIAIVMALFVIAFGVGTVHLSGLLGRVHLLETRVHLFETDLAAIRQGLQMLERHPHWSSEATRPLPIKEITSATSDVTRAVAELVSLFSPQQQASKALMPSVLIKSHVGAFSSSRGAVSLGTRGFVQRSVHMQTDGNLVIYEKGMLTGTDKPIWATDTDLGNKRTRSFTFRTLHGTGEMFWFEVCDEGQNHCTPIKKLNTVGHAHARILGPIEHFEITYDGMDLVHEDKRLDRQRLVTF